MGQPSPRAEEAKSIPERHRNVPQKLWEAIVDVIVWHEGDENRVFDAPGSSVLLGGAASATAAAARGGNAGSEQTPRGFRVVR
jgi:hypothetical protein